MPKKPRQANEKAGPAQLSYGTAMINWQLDVG
jgi:hypothetical protein